MAEGAKLGLTLAVGVVATVVAAPAIATGAAAVGVTGGTATAATVLGSGAAGGYASNAISNVLNGREVNENWKTATATGALLNGAGHVVGTSVQAFKVGLNSVKSAAPSVGGAAAQTTSKLAAAAKWTPHPGFQMPAADKGRFLGDVGNSGFALADDAAAAMGVPRGTSVPWREGIPDFGAHAVPGPGGIPSTFSVPGLTGAHAADRTLMLQQMAAQSGMSQRAVQQWLSTNNVRLHHSGGQAVQIVPAPIHGLHHSGGAQQLRGGN
jgi:hypothetical protein